MTVAAEGWTCCIIGFRYSSPCLGIEYHKPFLWEGLAVGGGPGGGGGGGEGAEWLVYSLPRVGGALEPGDLFGIELYSFFCFVPCLMEEGWLCAAYYIIGRTANVHFFFFFLFPFFLYESRVSTGALL